MGGTNIVQVMRVFETFGDLRRARRIIKRHKFAAQYNTQPQQQQQKTKRMTRHIKEQNAQLRSFAFIVVMCRRIALH